MADGQIVLEHGEKLRRAFREDGWMNVLTGLGTSRDKTTFSEFSEDFRLADQTAEALYSNDDMAARIADTLPEAIFRLGFDINVTSQEDKERREAQIGASPDGDPQATDPEADQTLQRINSADAALIAKDVKDAATRLGLQSKFVESLVWARVYGLGAILLGADDGAMGPTLSEPLNTEGIRRFDHMNVLDKQFMQPSRYYTDPTAPNFGRPETYWVSPNAINANRASSFNSDPRSALTQGVLEIHETRMVIFRGVRTPIRRRQRLNGFDDSVFQRIHTVLRDFGMTWRGLSNLMSDAQQGIYKMKGFIDMLASRNTDSIQRRLEMMDISRSIARAVIVDADMEDFQRQDFNFTGTDKVMQLFMTRLSAAARMPTTILMSQSPSGMDATGASDLTWWNDVVASEQENEVKPLLKRVIELIMLAREGPTEGMVPPAWDVVFPELDRPTPVETADIRLKQAQTDEIEINTGMITPEEAATSRHTPDGWSADTQIDLAARREMMEADDFLEPDPEPVPMLPAPVGAPEPEVS